MINNMESDYRSENKFVITNFSLAGIKLLIYQHPFIFKEIYSKRFVNNIYFDSIDFHSYNDNINGSQNRVKARIRWYGSLTGFIEKPTLEFKIKNGLIGKKIKIDLKSFNITGSDDINSIARNCINQINEKNLSIIISQLTPTIVNRYLRYYYLSENGLFRITLDDSLSYYPIINNSNFDIKTLNYKNIIMELKYSRNADYLKKYIIQHFPFRLSKSSKYINGVKLIYK
jgi:hypothetical protein